MTTTDDLTTVPILEVDDAHPLTLRGGEVTTPHPRTSATGGLPPVTPPVAEPSPSSRAFLAENVRLNNDLKQLTRRLSSIAVMHCSRLQPNGETVCACCLLPYPCGTVSIARGGAE